MPPLKDSLLDSMDASASLIEQSVSFPEELLKQNETLQVITSVFEEDALPRDRRRLSETASRWLAAAGLLPSDMEQLLERHRDLVAAKSISPLDAILGALLRERKDELLAGYRGRFVISSELTTSCAEAGTVPKNRAVELE